MLFLNNDLSDLSDNYFISVYPIPFQLNNIYPCLQIAFSKSNFICARICFGQSTGGRTNLPDTCLNL